MERSSLKEITVGKHLLKTTDTNSMNAIYNTAILAYSKLVKTAALWNRKARLMTEGQAKTMQTIRAKFKPDDHPVWIHAASLGEFEQGRPIIERIRSRFPDRKILLTFFSPSGYEVRKKYAMVDAVCYLPFDTEENAEEFIGTLQPSLAIFVKYEFWGNYLEALSEHAVPTMIVSAIFRRSQLFFRPYGSMFRRMLRCFTAGIYVQDADSKALLSTIGIDSIVAGDTRFDRVTDIMATTKNFPSIAEFASDGMVMVAGSSWPRDEELIIDYFNRHPRMKLIIAPHEFDDARVDALRKKIARPSLRYSRLYDGEKIDGDCLILDCFGILSSCYRYGSIAYVGGGFGVGIHNINEAAVYGIPVIFGPNYKKFKEARDLVGRGGAFSVSKAADYEAVLDHLIANEDARIAAGDVCGEYIRENLGASDRIFNDIAQILASAK